MAAAGAPGGYPGAETERPSLPTGTAFSEALKAAVENRGLALSRLRDHLGQRGFRVSVATLSYWQSGRSQPERALSLQALDALEEILEVPATSLRSLLDAPRPRGRQVAVPGIEAATIVEGWEELERQGRANLERVRRLSIHLLMTVHADRTAVIEARGVSRVHADEADRVSVYLGQTGPSDRPPEILPRRGCTIGAVHTSPSADAVIAELQLAEALPRGATFTVEYDLATHQRETTANTLIEIHRTGQSVLGVTFDPAALPQAVRLVETTPGGAVTTSPLKLRADHSLVVSRQDFGPGRLSIEWDW